MKTKIFCDIADYKTIKLFNKKKIIDGFTTNPSLMRLAGFIAALAPLPLIFM